MSDQINLTSKSENIKNLNDDYVVEMKDWTVIKAEVDNLLQTSKSGYELLKKSKEVSDYWSRVRDQRRRTR